MSQNKRSREAAWAKRMSFLYTVGTMRSSIFGMRIASTNGACRTMKFFTADSWKYVRSTFLRREDKKMVCPRLHESIKDRAA
jgi:hypothetical protein